MNGGNRVSGPHGRVALARRAPMLVSPILTFCCLLLLFAVRCFPASIPSLHPLRAALISCLRNLVSQSASNSGSGTRTCNIVLSTSSCSATHFGHADMGVHPFLRDFFKPNFTVAFHKPSPLSLAAFYRSILRETTLNLGEYRMQRQTTRSAASQSSSKRQRTNEENASESSNPRTPMEHVTMPGSSTDEGLVALPVATAPPPSSPLALSPSSSDVRSSFDAFLSRSSSPSSPSPLDVPLHLRATMGAADFLSLQRLELNLDRWMRLQQQQQEAGRNRQKRTTHHAAATPATPPTDVLPDALLLHDMDHTSGKQSDESALQWDEVLATVSAALEHALSI